METIDILLVDDRADGLVALEAVLACPEYRLVTASSGREALSRLLNGNFAVIILDVQMPEMDGFETATLIKQREKTRDIPIVFVTAINKDTYFVFKGYDAGAVDYIFKPFDPRVLRTKVKVFAELHQKTQTLLEQTARLKRSEEAKRIVIESARDIIATSDLNGRITSLSPAFRATTGLEPARYLGRPIDALVYPPDADRFRREFARALRGEATLIEWRLANDKAEAVFVESSARPLIQDGTAIGAMSVIRDITERKEAERERNRRQALERANAELEQFAHICSHDLQEPLRTMSSFAYLLRDKAGDRLGPEADGLIDELLAGASRMSCLIQDLLSYSRAGSSEFAVEEFGSGRSLSRALENLAQLITKSGTRISFSGLPVVQGSELLLAQVFQNLVSNAIKFRRSEPPQIHVSAEEGQDEWIFCVRDNGIGFKMEYAEKIFQVFKRLHHSDEYPGTGIGLGICKRIVERHGGRIWAVSEEGKGASFFFALPRGPRPRLQPPHPQLSSAYEGHDAVGFPS